MLHVGIRLDRCQPAFEVKSSSAIDLRSWVSVGLEASLCTSAAAGMQPWTLQDYNPSFEIWKMNIDAGSIK
jgi:hypothetical protein